MELIYFCGVNKKYLLLPLQWRLKQNFLCDLEKLIEYLASAVIAVSSNFYIGPSPRTNIPFFLLSVCTDELLSTSKITTFLSQSKPWYEKSERKSNSIPYPEKEYLSESA